MCLHYIFHKSQQNVSIPYMDGMGMKKLASLAVLFTFLFTISCLVVIVQCTTMNDSGNDGAPKIPVAFVYLKRGCLSSNKR